MKQQITEKDHLEKEWLKEAHEQTLETLPKFINHLMNDYEHDYGTCVKAVTAAMIGTFATFNKQEGFTGFQVGFIPWMMMDEFWGESKVGRRVIDFDKMLYPQYDFMYEKTITPKTFARLKEVAQKKIEEAAEALANGDENYVCNNVYRHWKSIAEGNIPFGYKISDE